MEEEINNFLLEKKSLIFDSLDKLSKTASDIIVQKNNRILVINNEKHDLNKKIESLESIKVSRKLPNINELLFIRKNNKLCKKLIKKEIKVIARELEEKEKIIRNNNITIEKFDKERQLLLQEVENNRDSKNILEGKLSKLEIRNKELEEINNYQLNTIKTITNELKNKNEKIMELKDYFIQILDSYNDILQKVS